MNPIPISAITFGRVAPGIPVRDIQAACTFYSDILGFQKVFENGAPVGFMMPAPPAASPHEPAGTSSRASAAR